ncbi:hypothetical protein ALTERO38_51750 [Alteromonas sp. 38]|nr:hypothetical protein ALTER154_80299 [Alteromonas sp. 154]VXB85705.1 hypothetical protein ALTERO38_51750 [Alteromonas sp. 38]
MQAASLVTTTTKKTNPLSHSQRMSFRALLFIFPHVYHFKYTTYLYWRINSYYMSGDYSFLIANVLEKVIKTHYCWLNSDHSFA